MASWEEEQKMEAAIAAGGFDRHGSCPKMRDGQTHTQVLVFGIAMVLAPGSKDGCK